MSKQANSDLVPVHGGLDELVDRIVPLSQRAQSQLGHQDGARLFEATHHGRVFSDDLILERPGAQVVRNPSAASRSLAPHGMP